MKRILSLLPAFALLGGCAGFTSDMLRQDVQIGVGVVRGVSCSIAAAGGFGNAIVQVVDAVACRAAGGTVAQ